MIPLLFAAGCGGPAAESGPRERTKFFAQLAAEPAAGTLKGWLQPKFPDLDLHVGRAGPMTLRAADGPARVQVEVQLVVKNTAKFKDAEPRLLDEWHGYFKALADSTGAEIVGPVQDEVQDGKRVGFRFAYRTAGNAGSVIVAPQDMVVGGLLATVAEWE